MRTKQVVRGELPRIKPRFGVIPTRIQKTAKTYTRKSKHKGQNGGQ